MKLWMGAEVQDDVYDENFAARKAIQDRVNERLQSRAPGGEERGLKARRP
jgi:hypothetical protein